MQRTAHLWNVNQLITKLNAPQTKYLQLFYLQSCRKFHNEDELPKQQFGASVMCIYCNSLWTTIDHKIRISPGKPMAKFVRKIRKSMENGEKIVPRVQSSLVKRAIKRQTNSMRLTCSVCSRVTKLPLGKPNREKVHKTIKTESSPGPKRKRKKNKDKTAGLNIPTETKEHEQTVPQLPVAAHSMKLGTMCSPFVQKQKLKKLSINRLKDIVSKGITPPKTKSLHSFLSEL